MTKSIPAGAAVLFALCDGPRDFDNVSRIAGTTPTQTTYLLDLGEHIGWVERGLEPMTYQLTEDGLEAIGRADWPSDDGT